MTESPLSLKINGHLFLPFFIAKISILNKLSASEYTLEHKQMALQLKLYLFQTGSRQLHGRTADKTATMGRTNNITMTVARQLWSEQLLPTFKNMT